MQAPMPAGSLPGGFVPPGSSATGARTLRTALGRLERLVSIAIAVAVLAIVEAYLTWTGVFGKLPQPGAALNLSWSDGLLVGLAVAAAVAIAVLVIIAIVTAVLGLISWRRGVLAMVAASAELGPAQVESCSKARRDHSLTLWMFLVFVLVAIVVAATFAGVNSSLAVVGLATMPGTVSSIATALATGAVLVAVYYYGTRHLVELLAATATEAERTLLNRGRNRMIAGALVGLGAAFSSLSWGFDVLGVVSLAVILPGVRDLARAYDLWLVDHPAPAPGLWRAGPAPA